MTPQYEDDEPAARSSMPQVSFPRMTPVVKWLLVVNLCVFLAQFSLYLLSENGTYATVLQKLALAPRAWTEGFPLLPAWQLVTYGFLHDIKNIGHIVGNMLILFFFGTMFEAIVGSRRFAIHYFAAMLAGAVLQLSMAFAGVTHAWAIGASGACMGVMIAVATLRPNQSVLVLFIPVLLKWLAIGILAIDFLGALMELKGESDGTAHFVHLGGIAYGFLAVRFGLIYKDPVEVIERKRAVRAMVRENDDEARMDQLLEKIHKEGMSSLSRSEKDFLKRMSSRR